MARFQTIYGQSISIGASERFLREQDLRAAQEQAFDEVKKAKSSADRAAAMHSAVADLVAACERFISEAIGARSKA